MSQKLCRNLCSLKTLKPTLNWGPVHTTPFLYKNGEKNIRFCLFTLICLITKTERKTSVFVRSHCSVFVNLIVHYCSVFKNLRFCAFTLIQCVFKNLRFCGYPLLTAFSKTSVFVPFLCRLVWTLSQKRMFFPPFSYKNGVVWTGSFDSTKTDINKNGVVNGA